MTILKEGDYHRYDYDLTNRLRAVYRWDEERRTEVLVKRYTYNATGYRILAEDALGAQVFYTFDLEGKVIERSDSDGTRNYVFLGSKVIAFKENGKTYYYGTDHLGSTTLITDASGKKVWSGAVTPFADQESSEGDLDESVLYTGKELDPDTGLYYFNARWYDPELGRFITEDPVRDGVNWFVYVGNNPLGFVDPSGLWKLQRDGTAIAESGDTLWGLSEMVSGDGANWTKLQGHKGSPESLQVGAEVNWSAMSYTMTVLNKDPTPTANQIAEFGKEPNDLKVGHTWMTLEKQGMKPDSFGWGHSGNGALLLAQGLTQPGALLTYANKEQNKGNATSQFSRMITEVEGQSIKGLWNKMQGSGTGYNYGGRNIDPQSTYCTQALFYVLEQSNILTPSEMTVLNNPYPNWGSTVPSNAPPYVTANGGLEDIYGHLTDPAPDLVDERFNILNSTSP